MPRFTSYDGTTLAYHERGEGEPLMCVPGGAGRASDYLGDLGGLDAHRRLVLLDNRGTGESDPPRDPATYRRDLLVQDVEVLRRHLGLDRVDLLGHSAGAGIAMGYAANHPDRVRRLVLLTPALRIAGLEPAQDDWDRHVQGRRHESWFATATAGLDAVQAGTDDVASRLAMAPLFYGRWDAVAQAHAAAEEHERSAPAARGYWADGAPDPTTLRAALARLIAPVLVHAGSADPISPPARCRDLAALFPASTFLEQPDAGHFPWLDDPRWLVEHLTAWWATT